MERGVNRTIQVYDQMMNHFAAFGIVPTYREILLATGLQSVSTVSYHFQRLADMGWLIRQEGSKRAYKLNRPTERGLSADQLLKQLRGRGKVKQTRVRIYNAGYERVKEATNV